MFNIHQRAGADLLKESAKGAIPFLFWASMSITTLGFAILLGSLELFLTGLESDHSLSMIGGVFLALICGILGYGFVRTELAINIQWAIKRQLPGVAIAAMVLIVATNFIIGVYRSNAKTSTETYAFTQKVQDDFLIRNYLAEKDSIQRNVYHDGTASNDATATRDIKELNTKIEARTNELVSVLKPVSDGTYNLFVLAILGFISVVFSAAIQIAYEDEHETVDSPTLLTTNGKNHSANDASFANGYPVNRENVTTAALLAKIAKAGYEKTQFVKIVKDAVFATVREGETRFFAKAALHIILQYGLAVHRDEVRLLFIQETGLRNRREIENTLS